MSARSLFVELGINDKKLSSGLQKSEKRIDSFGKRTAAKLKKSFATVKLAAAGAAAFGLQQAASSVFEFEDTLDRLATQAKLTNKQTDALRQNLIDLSKDTGVSRNSIVEAQAEFINLGLGAEFAAKNIDTLTKAHVGTGAATKDIVGVQFTNANSFGITDADEQKAALNGIIAIGDAASIPFDRMADASKEAGASMAEFGNTGVDAVLTTAVAMQALNKEGFADANQAKTGIKNFAKTMTSKAKILRKYGIETMVTDANGVKSLAKFDPIIEQLLSSDLAKDPELLQSVLGDYDSFRAAKGFMNQFEWMEKLKEEAKSRNAIDEAYDRRRQSAAHRIAKSWNNVKEAIADTFTPERIERFVKGVERVAEMFGGILDNLKTVIGLMAVAKFGPGAAGAALAGGRAFASTGAGAAVSAMGASAAGAAGLLTAAAALGVGFGLLLDHLFDFSGKLSNLALDVLGPWEKVAEAAPSKRIEALNERLASGEITQEKYDTEKQGQVRAFAFRGANALTSLIGSKVLEKTGGTLEDQQERYDSLGRSEKDRIREMARQAIIKKGEGLDTTELANKIASAIQGSPIKISLNGNAITTMLEGSISRIR